MENKFLSDGRKVAVIGQLNNTETIVQEVFVTDAGDEIPSGERFVVKSLHDEPVKSYKDKELDKKASQLIKIESDIKSAYRRYSTISEELKGLKALLKSSQLTVENVNDGDLDILKSFISGSTEYICRKGYSIDAPIKFTDAIMQYERRYGGERSFDGLKLLSVAGRSNGDLSYWLHQYSDGSGSYSEIHPFNSYEDAVEFTRNIAEERIKEGTLGLKEYKTCLELGICFTRDQVESIKVLLIDQAEKSLLNAKSYQQNSIDSAEKTLTEISSTFNEL